jgi:HEAT repeat protein
MRRLAPLPLLFGIVLGSGCGGKKPAPQTPEPETPAKADAPPAADPAAGRTKLLAGLKNTNQEVRRNAIEELSWLAEEDPAVLPALVELLRDKGTAAAGSTLANRINSTREAAALAILQCTNGNKLMAEKGLPVLREGLKDPSAAVRAHTAYTVGLLGPIAKPLAADVQRLCTDPDANVRGVAFDALRATGVADPVALAKLLKSDNAELAKLAPDDRAEVARLAGELIPLVTDMPEAAVAPLADGLASPNSNVQAAAANGLAAAGPKAGSAAPQVAAAIVRYYPADYDPNAPRAEALEMAYWLALSHMGEAAVAPTAKLLGHTNPLVRWLAARTLGEIGPPALAAKDALKKALGDRFINVGVEAVVALCKLNEPPEDAVKLMTLALDQKTDGVARAAIEGVPRMGAAGKPLVPAALAKMAEDNPNTRYAAVWLVGQIPVEEAAKAAAEVGKRATDPEPDIRRLVGRVLEQLGPAGAPAAEALGQAVGGEAESDVRTQFVEALVAMGPGARPALPGLLPLLADTNLTTTLRARIASAVVTADPASPEVAAALTKAASDPDRAVRSAAADALGRLDPLPPDALAALVKLAKGDRANAPLVAASRALTTAGPRAKGARGELETIAAGPQAGLALWAKVAGAAVAGDVKRAAPDVRAGLVARKPLVRAAAAEALLVVGPTQDDLPALLKILNDATPTAKAASATGIGQLGPVAKEAVPQLRRLLDDHDAEVRAAAATALGRIGPDARPALAKLKELRADPLVGPAARRAVEQIGAK